LLCIHVSKMPYAEIRLDWRWYISPLVSNTSLLWSSFGVLSQTDSLLCALVLENCDTTLPQVSSQGTYPCEFDKGYLLIKATY
jgi:hypothetical protein